MSAGAQYGERVAEAVRSLRSLLDEEFGHVDVDGRVILHAIPAADLALVLDELDRLRQVPAGTSPVMLSGDEREDVRFALARCAKSDRDLVEQGSPLPRALVEQADRFEALARKVTT